MHRPESDIPVGTQFSPSLVDLPAFVRALVAQAGNKERIEEAVWSPAVRTKAKTEAPTRRNKSLPVEAAVQYGLLTTEYDVTPLARRLAVLDSTQIYEEFGKHI